MPPQSPSRSPFSRRIRPGVMNCRECTRLTDSPSARSAYFSRGARRESEKPRGEKGQGGVEGRMHKVSRVQVNVLTVSRANRSFHFVSDVRARLRFPAISNYRGNAHSARSLARLA